MNKFEEIRQYKDLLDKGIITEQEYQQKRHSLLDIPDLGGSTESVNDNFESKHMRKTEDVVIENNNPGEIENGNIPNKKKIVVFSVIIVILLIFLIAISLNSKKNESLEASDNLYQEQLQDGSDDEENEILKESKTEKETTLENKTEKAVQNKSNTKNEIVGNWMIPNSGIGILCIKDDGTFYISELDGTRTSNGTWSLDGNTIYVKYEGGSEVYTYDKKNKRMVSNNPELSSEYWIKVK